MVIGINYKIIKERKIVGDLLMQCRVTMDSKLKDRLRKKKLNLVGVKSIKGCQLSIS